MRKLVRDLVVRTYCAPPVQHFFGTPAGRPIYEALYLQYKERLEVPGSGLLKQFLGDGDWAIDVGANIGFFTEKFARWVHGGGKVLAIEPERDNADWLVRRLGKQGLAARVVVKHGAAADADGQLQLAVNRRHPGDHRLSDRGETTVRGWRLDSLVAEAGSPRVGLIKIDVQGAEMRVLAGADATLRRCRPAVFVEVDARALKGFGASAADLLDYLEARGYVFALLRRRAVGAVTKTEILEQSHASSDYRDVLAVPASVAAPN
jgi:FkbM family methyltransferase